MTDREQITPHVCQFCETPLRGHWWDPCTYTPTPTSPVTAEQHATGTPTTPSTDDAVEDD